MWSHRRSLLSAACAGVAFVAVACGGSSGGNEAQPGTDVQQSSAATTTGVEAPQDLVDAAKKEGKVVFYSVDSEDTVAAVAEAFQKKYGIDTQYIRLTSSKIETRYKSEQDAGAVNADLVVVSNGGFALEGAKDGTFIPVEGNVPGFPFPDFNEKFLNSDEGTPTESLPLKAIGYNTDLVKSADVPKTWEDLLDPKWKGKILFVDPASSTSYVQMYHLLLDQYGADFLTKLAAQGKRIYSGTVPLTQALGAGEGAFAVPPTIDEIKGLADKGAPVAYTTPPLSSGSEHVLCLSAKAPHPKAARLLAHFILSPEGAKVLERPGTITPYDKENFPSQYTPVKLTDLDQQKEDVMKAFASLTK